MDERRTRPNRSAAARCAAAVAVSLIAMVSADAAVAGSITGSVTDASSAQPVQFIQVTAFRVGPPEFLGASFSDADGKYTIEGLDGKVVLQFSDPLGGYPLVWNGAASTGAAAAPIPVDPIAGNAHDEQLAARPNPHAAAHTLAGTISGPDGALPGIRVRATDGTLEYSTVSDRSGRWALATADGDFTIRFEQASGWSLVTPDSLPWFGEFYPAAWNAGDAEQVSIAAGRSVDGLDVSMIRSGRIRVQATGRGSGPLQTGFRLVDDTGATVTEVSPQAGSTDWVDALVRPGTYRLLVTGRRLDGSTPSPLLPQWYSTAGGVRSRALGTPLTVEADASIVGGAVDLPPKLQALSGPRVIGRRVVGARLTSTSGVWNLATETTLTYRWTRGSRTVSRARSYRPVRADAGRRLNLVVTARNGGFVGSASATVKIARLATAAGAAVDPLGGGRVGVQVRVIGSGLTPKGHVTVMRGAVPVGTGVLRDGRSTIGLVNQPPGTGFYRVVYHGSSRHMPSRSAMVMVVVG